MAELQVVPGRRKGSPDRRVKYMVRQPGTEYKTASDGTVLGSEIKRCGGGSVVEQSRVEDKARSGKAEVEYLRQLGAKRDVLEPQSNVAWAGRLR
ncbi:unnamed protein product [Clonostachys byssicola]|uniref:Uncharacterized protein n=1 Tax=Clonostachys byssicola TaxID=160290 RepID=A0A9N9V293_9HYPO|nr:unnamed protein product [Clonostachys byssicola]